MAKGHEPAEVAARMLDAGCSLHTLERYHMAAPARPGRVFGYGIAGPEQVESALRRLAPLLARAP